MDATLVDQVLDAVVDRMKGDLSHVEVIDSEPLVTNGAELLVVGFSVNRAAVEIVQAVSDLGDHRDESLSIVCLASSLRSETDQASARRVRGEAVAIVDAVKASLTDEPTLGGLVERAELGFGMALDQGVAVDKDGRVRGLTATVEFTIVAAVM